MGGTGSKPLPPEWLSSAQVELLVGKAQYSAGELVDGCLYVTTSAQVPVSSAYVVLESAVRTKVHYTTRHTRTTGSGKHRRTHTTVRHHITKQYMPLLKMQCQVGAFSGHAAPGTYQLPFQFQLPRDAPSSVLYGSVSGRSYTNGLMISHTLTAWVEALGQQVPIRITNLDVMSAVTVVPQQRFLSTLQPVTTCCCFGRGNVELSARLSSNLFIAGTSGTLSYKIMNSSRVDISKVFVRLVKHVWFNANGHSKSFSETLLEREVHALISRKPNQTAVNESTASSEGSLTTEICWPPNLEPTLSTPMARIHYTVIVSTHCGSCLTSDPKVVLDVVFHRKPLDAGRFHALSTEYAQVMQEARVSQGGLPLKMPALMTENFANQGPHTASSTGSLLRSPMPLANSKAVLIDTTGDGYGDTWAFDTTKDGIPDVTVDGRPVQMETLPAGASTACSGSAPPSAPTAPPVSSMMSKENYYKY